MVDLSLSAVPQCLHISPTSAGKAKFEKALKELDKEYKGQVAGIVKVGR